MSFQVGLTGGIASGKSTVSALFAEAGFTIVDYDLLARKVVAPGSAGLAQIESEFGPEFIDREGRLDRIKMGGLVFADKEALQKLESITHPLILREAEVMSKLPVDVLIHDNPLLIEMGAYRACDLVVVVDVSEEVQMNRMMTMRGMSEDDARLRLANQVTRSDRLQYADLVIDNSGGIGALHERVAEVVAEIRARS